MSKKFLIFPLHRVKRSEPRCNKRRHKTTIYWLPEDFGRWRIIEEDGQYRLELEPPEEEFKITDIKTQVWKEIV